MAKKVKKVDGVKDCEQAIWNVIKTILLTIWEIIWPIFMAAFIFFLLVCFFCFIPQWIDGYIDSKLSEHYGQQISLNVTQGDYVITLPNGGDITVKDNSIVDEEIELYSDTLYYFTN